MTIETSMDRCIDERREERRARGSEAQSVGRAKVCGSRDGDFALLADGASLSLARQLLAHDITMVSVRAVDRPRERWSR